MRGTVWSAMERFSVQGVMFAVTVVMANFVDPAGFGLVGMLTVFMAVSQSLVDAGFTQALIRKQDRDEKDCSTVFWFNLAMSTGLCAILYFCAPPIARYYEHPVLAPMLKVLALALPLNAISVVQRALLTVRMDFRTQAKASLVAAILSGALGIVLAVRGAGAWALVWQQVANAGLGSLLLWAVARWRPRAVWSGTSFRALFGFGSRLAAAGIIDTVYRQGWGMLIGKYFPAAVLGYYTNAQRFADLPTGNLTYIIQRVSYPVMCSMQSDPVALGAAYGRYLRMAAFCVFPLILGLAAVAHPLLRLVLGSEWDFAAVLLQIMCLQMMWFPIHAINLNLLQVLGRSDLFLRLEIYKKICGVAILCATLPFGIIAMCWGAVVVSHISLAINTSATHRLGYPGLWAQMRDLLPPLGYAAATGAAAWCAATLLPGNDWLRLAAGIIAGAATFLALGLLTRSADLRALLQLVSHRNEPASTTNRTTS